MFTEKNIFKKICVLLTFCLFTIFISGCTDNNAINKNNFDKKNNISTIIGLTYIPNIQFSPFYVAEYKKYFPKNVKIRHHGADEGLFDALISGSENIIVAGADEAVKAMDSAKNLDLVVLSKYYNKYPTAIFGLKSKNINKPKDLIGKTIGIPGKYGENWYGLLYFLKENGIDKKDVNIKEIGYTQLSAMKTRQVDAVVGFLNNDLVQFQMNNIDVSTIKLSDKEINLMPASIITTRKYAQRNPERIKHIVEGIQKSIKFAVNNPEKTVDISNKTYLKDLNDKKNSRVALKVLKQTNKLFVNNNEEKENIISENTCQKMISFMIDEKILDKKYKSYSSDKIKNECKNFIYKP